MARIGYARVSTRSQNDDSQVDDLTAYGCDKIFADTASGKHAARPGARQGARLSPCGRLVARFGLMWSGLFACRYRYWPRC